MASSPSSHCFGSWFLLGCVGCVELEKDNIAVLHNVVPALLPVFSRSLKQIETNSEKACLIEFKIPFLGNQHS